MFRKLDVEKSKLRFLEASEEWLRESEKEFGVHERLRRGVRVLQKREEAPAGSESPRPHFFLVPNVESRPLFDLGDFPWMEDLRSGFSEIKKELERNDALWKRKATPYADNNIIHKRKFKATRETWHLLPIAKYKREFERTWSILQGCPLYKPNSSELCLFSIMKPKAHIPPHTGILNNRLVCHLPLVAPEGCGLRVGDQTIDVKEGEPYLFDDCFEHEAWNRSDESRIVMIFVIAHPNLEEAEMKALGCFIKRYRSYRKRLKKKEQEFILKYFEISYGDD